MKKIDNLNTFIEAVKLVEHRIKGICSIVLLTDSLDYECSFLSFIAMHNSNLEESKKNEISKNLNILMPNCVVFLVEEHKIRDKHMLVWSRNTIN